MGVYRVPFSKLVTTTVTVEASTEEEAIRKAVLEVRPYIADCYLEVEYAWELDSDVEEVQQ